MKVTLESTEKFVTLNGVPARIWEGTTEHGTKVQAFITRIGHPEGEDGSEFERDLSSASTPRPEPSVILSRFIL